MRDSKETDAVMRPVLAQDFKRGKINTYPSVFQPQSPCEPIWTAKLVFLGIVRTDCDCATGYHSVRTNSMNISVDCSYIVTHTNCNYHIAESTGCEPELKKGVSKSTYALIEY